MSEVNTAGKPCTHTVYVDGSCVGNGSNGAKAGIGLFWGDNHPWNISNALAQEDGEVLTNNKAELRAAIRAIEIAREHNVAKLVINSDSKYVVLGITQWIHQWQKNSWKNSNGEKVKNKEDWTKLLGLVEDSDVDIIWNHVPGHSGVAGNEEADALAVQGATGKPSDKVIKSDASAVTPSDIMKSADTLTGQSDKKTILNTTPTKIKGRDLSNTPVPGSVNGFNATQKHKTGTTEKYDYNSLSSEEGKLFKIITNVETVLETVLMEIHQTKQDNFRFQQKVTDTLEKLQMKQNVIEESVSKMSVDIVTNIHKTISQIEKTSKAVSEIDRSSCANTAKEVKAGINEIQKDLQTRLEGIKHNTKSTESSMNSLKKGVRSEVEGIRNRHGEITKFKQSYSGVYCRREKQCNSYQRDSK